ncbi:MAG: ABC transporter permease [Thermodesulfobacteriota bacterium]|nr:ABC transporter permease [Thermodesulfobacteriota bacterium]
MGTLAQVNLSEKTLEIRLKGDWTSTQKLPAFQDMGADLKAAASLTEIRFNTDQLTAWDSGAAVFLFNLYKYCASRDITFNDAGLPKGIQKLLALAAAVPEKKDSSRQPQKLPLLRAAKKEYRKWISSVKNILSFTGDIAMALLRLIQGKSSMRRSVFIFQVQECSSKALPIVSLISFLVGLILAFIGAVQLMMFGAQIYVASLVGIAMIRVMGAVMTGVIMAGRTGAAFAAQIGTMEINEEVDALKTLGISPIDYLVLPRLLALAVTMPLLCLYADIMGVAGGMAVGIFMLDLNVMEYFNMTKHSVSLNDFGIGIFQSFVFGILVAVSGCLRGLQCSRSASAVGSAATSAVVTSIVAIVIATALITLICSIVGI